MIRFTNSLTGAKETLKTKLPGILNWYACGPTVYDDAHIGHARTFISQDIIRRILTHYGGFRVNLQIGITDIDDKIIARSRGEDFRVLVQRYEESFLRSMIALKMIPPTKFSRVTDNMGAIIEFIQRLLDLGVAYQAPSGSIYFSIREYKALGHTYHLLSSPCSSNTDTHSALQKRDPADFALWKAAKSSEEPSWSAFNRKGRPGWHIECSAMSKRGFLRRDSHICSRSTKGHGAY